MHYSSKIIVIYYKNKYFDYKVFTYMDFAMYSTAIFYKKYNNIAPKP
jgi:hypothetical protein